MIVHGQAQQAVALDGDGPVAVLLDELPEEIVAQVEQDHLAVGGLTEGEHPRPVREQGADGGGVDGLGEVFEVSRSLNGIVEPSVQTFPRTRAERWHGTFNTGYG
ncbi:hypothetical protein GA0070214_103138 [Micromonospora chaiyaphumensis]|uniref:Uncharacterized protein n=1 Tax=Micromonospora chaiyaphumensis TaxID=307119 RepID=A0A1C4W299_9ACTN|nr:hypothetical protein GA0070214_103138 [Micromonospora chaiyaphumensis]